MQRNIFVSSILIASSVASNTFSENICNRNPRLVSFGAGPAASRMGDLSFSSAQFGGGISLSFYGGKSSGLVAVSNISGSYLMRDEFDDSDRIIGTEIYGVDTSSLESSTNADLPLGKIDPKQTRFSSGESGIKNTNILFSLGLGKDMVFSKEDDYHLKKGENCYCAHIGIGINFSLELDYIKNKNKFIPIPFHMEWNSLKIAINKVDISSMKVGIFIDSNYNSENHLSSMSSEFGASLYGTGTYKFDVSFIYVKQVPAQGSNYESVPDSINTTIKIKTIDNICAYVGLNIVTVYKVSKSMYAGIRLSAFYNYRTAKTSEDAISSDPRILSIFYNESQGVNYYPIVKDNEFKDPLSNSLRGSFHFVVMYSGK